MSLRVYTMTVLSGVLTWAMFGMSLGMMLQSFGAGLTPVRHEVAMVGLWLLMGAGDVWWLLRFGAVRPVPRAELRAPGNQRTLQLTANNGSSRRPHTISFARS